MQQLIFIKKIISPDDSDDYDSDFDYSEFDSEEEVEIENDESEVESEVEPENEDSILESINTVVTNANNFSKSGIQWYEVKVGEKPNKSSSQNVFLEKYGATTYAKTHIDETALSAFLCIIDKSILKIVVDCTNKFASSRKSNFCISITELLSFIGVLLARGVFGGNVPFKSLWSMKYGPEEVRSLMSRDNCLKIMRYLRFDDKSSRSSRAENDKFALIRDVWERFVENSQACYKPFYELTIDEQLLPSKSRCRIKI